MGNPFGGILSAIIFLCVIVAVCFGAVAYWAGRNTSNSNKLESEKIIVPRIKLKTDGVKVDTIYIYEK